MSEAEAPYEVANLTPRMTGLADGRLGLAGFACWSFHRTDTRREITQAPRGECARCGHCAHQTISRKSTASYRPAPRPGLAIPQDKCTD
jgi:hypothetical protein